MKVVVFLLIPLVAHIVQGFQYDNNLKVMPVTQCFHCSDQLPCYNETMFNMKICDAEKQACAIWPSGDRSCVNENLCEIHKEFNQDGVNFYCCFENLCNFKRPSENDSIIAIVVFSSITIIAVIGLSLAIYGLHKAFETVWKGPRPRTSSASRFRRQNVRSEFSCSSLLDTDTKV